jgi:hypothetical protein
MRKNTVVACWVNDRSENQLYKRRERHPANHCEAVGMPIARAGAQPEKEVAQAVEK